VATGERRRRAASLATGVLNRRRFVVARKKTLLTMRLGGHKDWGKNGVEDILETIFS